MWPYMYKREREYLQKEFLKIEVLQQKYETTKLDSVILWAEAVVYYISDIEHIYVQKKNRRFTRRNPQD